MLLVNSVSHKISLGEDAPIAFGAPVGWVGISYGAPVGLGRDCLRRSCGGGSGLPTALPWGGNGIAFGAPVGWEPAATPRIELENPPAFAGAIFLCPELTENHFDAPRA